MTNSPAPIQIVAARTNDDLMDNAVIDTDGVITHCHYKYAKAAYNMLNNDLTPVMASIDENGNVWSIWQA